MSWQKAAIFEFGISKTIELTANLNSFPSTPNQIIQNIELDNYDLNAPENQQAKGFPALDYLLFGWSNNDSEIVTILSQEVYYKYVLNLISNMQTRVELVLEDWVDAKYRSTFIKKYRH